MLLAGTPRTDQADDSPSQSWEEVARQGWGTGLLRNQQEISPPSGKVTSGRQRRQAVQAWVNFPSPWPWL